MSSSRRPRGGQRPSPHRRPTVAGLRKPSPGPRSEWPENPEEPDTATPSAPGDEPAESAADSDSDVPEVDDVPEPVKAAPSSPRPGRAKRERPSPGPRASRRDSGAAGSTDLAGSEEPADEPEASETTLVEHHEEPTGRRVLGGYPALAALAVAALVLAGLAVFFQLRHSEATTTATNEALVDVAATAEVKQAMSGAAERLFSVDFNDLDKTERAADELLVGEEVKNTHNALMGAYRKQADKQKIVVTTTAVRSAVVRLEGDRARVMVYVDQTTTRPGKEPAGALGAMWFQTERRDGAWKVVNMDVYGARQPSGVESEPAPEGSEPSSSQAGDSTEGN